MPVAVRSFAKINLGLRIGAARDDGFHELLTVYQTIGLHDLVKVRIERGTGIEIRCADPRVPRDESNTCFRIAESTLRAFGGKGRVVIEIEKRLPIQGGLGGASARKGYESQPTLDPTCPYFWWAERCSEWAAENRFIPSRIYPRRRVWC